MTDTVFLRLLSQVDKGGLAGQAVGGLRRGDQDIGVFVVEPRSLRRMPGSPFAYWISESLRAVFARLPQFEGSNRTARVGLQTGDDFQFVRCWWEIAPGRTVSGSQDTTASAFRDQTLNGKRWVPFAKGGEYSPYYAEPHMVVNWERDGVAIREFVDPKTRKLLSRPQNSDFYFKPGLTWSERTSWFSVIPLPPGCIFSVSGKGLFVDGNLYPIQGLLGSSAANYLMRLYMARSDLDPKYQAGDVQRLPYPAIDRASAERIERIVSECICIQRHLRSGDEVTHDFLLPALLKVRAESLAERARSYRSEVNQAMQRAAVHQDELDEVAYRLYGIEAAEREAMQNVTGRRSIEGTSIGGLHNGEEAGMPAEAAAFTTQLTEDLISYAVGSAVGRWDIRLATGEMPSPTLPDPFAPLPVHSPGMLPLGPLPRGYPLTARADGILVDDPDHCDDVARRVRDVLALIFPGQHEEIEREASALLGVRDLKTYFSLSKHFFTSHIRRYSKSRRRAPIYWLLQSLKGSYSLWLYYHRLDRDTLFKALTLYVNPKIQLESNRLEGMRADKAGMHGEGGPAVRKLDKQIETQEALLSELYDFRDKLQQAADLGLEPNLDDGVVLNIAPLHELVPWKEAKAYWNELMAGKYEWSSIGKQLRAKGLVAGCR